MRAICVDSCFLIALYDPKDQHHERAAIYFNEYLETSRNGLLLPWPALYETVSTRMGRRKDSLANINRDWKILQRAQRVFFIDDREFREAALRECVDEIETPAEYHRSLSLVDRVIRCMLAAETVKIDMFITFNAGDFSDVCYQQGITLLR